MLDPYKSIYEKRKLKYIICEEKITVKWGSGGIEQFSVFFLKLIALISWLQYYKLKPLKPLFSRCKKWLLHCALCFCQINTTKVVQSCPIKIGWLWTRRDFVPRKTYLNFSCQNSTNMHKSDSGFCTSLSTLGEINFWSKHHLKTSTNQIFLFKNCLGKKRRSKVAETFRKFLEWGAERNLQWPISI